jgi:hypothetical protein
MTSNHHAPYVQGYTRVTMGSNNRQLDSDVWQIRKTSLSSDRSLQLDYVKSESLVNADQHAALNTVPGPCTHRPSHHERMSRPKSVRQPSGR